MHPYVVGNGARRLRRFDVARSPALAESSKSVGSLTLKGEERTLSHQKLNVYGKALVVVASLAKHSAAWNKGHAVVDLLCRGD